MSSEISISDLDLSEKPNTHHSEHIVEANGMLYVGYLVLDSHCSSPMDDCDGEGQIYENERHAEDGGRTFRTSLCLDAESSPNLALVEETIDRLVDSNPKQGWFWERQFQANWVQLAAVNAPFRDWCIDQSDGIDANPPEEFFRQVAAKLWRETLQRNGRSVPDETDAFDFDCFQEAQEKTLDEMLKASVVGDPNAVLLSKYEHSGVSWKILSYDKTIANVTDADGIWLPDPCALDEINRRAAIYAYGEVVESNSQFMAKMDSGECSSSFADWYQALNWLEAQAKGKIADLNKGRKRAALEVASQCIELQNDWLNGSCYGTVLDVFAKTPEGDWERIKSDCSMGIIGSDSAEAEMIAETNAAAKYDCQQFAA